MENSDSTIRGKHLQGLVQRLVEIRSGEGGMYVVHQSINLQLIPW